MLAYRRPITLLVPALDTLVEADAGAPTNRALASFAVMLTYRRSTTLLARALDAVVVADAGAPANSGPRAESLLMTSLSLASRSCACSQ